MKIKRYTGASTREVLASIRADLGPDAVILSNREIDGGVELMAAVDFDAVRLQAHDEAPARSAQPAPRPLPRQAPSAAPAKPVVAQQVVLPSWPSVDTPAGAGKPTPRQRTVAQAAAPVTKPAPQAAAAPAESEASQAMSPMWAGEIRNLRDELETLREWVRASVAQAPVGSPSAIELRLQAMGLEAQGAREVAALGADVDTALDAWLARLPLRPDARGDALLDDGVYALVGATGVGKTTTVAKLAARLVLRHGTDAVALVTTDTYRIGGVEQLRIYGRILGVPVAVARDAAELRAHLRAFGERRFVLVDTIGLSPRDTRLHEQLQWLGELGDAVRPLLLLAAGMSPTVYEQAWQVWRELPVAGCLLTKLDETPVFAGALQWLQRQRVPLWFYTDGQRVPEDLHAPLPANMRALLQRSSAAPRDAAAGASATRPRPDDAAPAVANSR